MEKEEPIFFSVVIPSYNSESTIKRAIDSVLDQSWSNYEIIVVDDSSTDRTSSIVEKIIQQSNQKITLIKNKINYGVAESRNRGISAAQGTFLAFLDSDDEWYPDKLLDDQTYIVSHKVNWVFSNYDVFDENGILKQKRIRRSGKYNYSDIIKDGNPIGLLTVVIRRSIIGNEKFSSLPHEDYRFWLKISKRGFEAYNTGKINAKYNISKNSLSSQKIKAAIWTLNIYLSETKNIFKVAVLFLGYLKNVIRRSNY